MEKTEKIDKIKSGKFFVWGDIAVFAVAVILVVFFSLWGVINNKNIGNTASVYFNGELKYNINLNENAYYVADYSTQTVEKTEKNGKIDGKEHYNIICVEGGYLYICYADCNDLTCERFGKIRYGGESIICLPHNLKIEIDGTSDIGGDF